MAATKREKAALRARDTLLESRDRARAYAGKVSAQHVHPLLKDAQASLDERLAAAGPGTFTEARLKTQLRQVRAVTRDLMTGMGGALGGAADDAAQIGAGGVLDYMGEAEGAFAGVATPLAFDEVAAMDFATAGAESSVMRRLMTFEPEGGRGAGILQRYGASTVGVFEQKMRVGMLTGMSMDEVAAQLREASPFLQGQPGFWADRIARTECLPGDTLVSAGVVRAVFRRWHEGDLFKVVTEGGREFSATPNHPMLTRRGWVGAGALNEGDDLICNRRQKDARSAGHENVETGPTEIRKIFDALSAVGIRERRRTAQPDFHGDAVDGQVDIARACGALCIGRHAAIYKPLAEFLFAPANHMREPRFCSACGCLLGVTQRVCFCARSKNGFALAQTMLDRSLRSLKVLSQALDAFTAAVSIGDLLRRQVASEISRMGGFEPQLLRAASSASYAHLPKMLCNKVVSDAEFHGDFRRAEAGDIEFDCVRRIERRSFRGHVFNLETREGHFTISGIYTGNCMGASQRAGVMALQNANEQVGGGMVKILSATFDERTAADSYAVHGQVRLPEEAFDTWYGPMLHPPARPNDREIVVPHHKEWPLPGYLRPMPWGRVVARWKMEGRKGAPPERPVMSTVKLGGAAKSDDDG